MSKAPHYALRALVLLLLLQQGCGMAKPSETDELKTFGLLYHNTQQVYQKPPTEWKQLFKLVDTPSLREDYDQLTRFKDAGYTIVWGTDATSLAASSTILCYAPNTLKAGGPVLFANGAVVQMSAEDLANAIKNAE
ncbi:hypothetical protein CA51_10970 [Rosistilla oblonga]|uniref:hypothetical protein n=1 Tax=Rosistilla oblonga TaxID=2527990 RepID=UPI0011889B78|nr:hypothetical protein [Rosistilla oblonga]QDV11236.1 hypothetical protein CA51_10970 [Rosistilla oblonga]